MTPKLFTTLKTYTRAEFGSDLFAGITVALVALPLSIAIAIASGAAPAVGFVTAIVAGFLISALGGSRVQIGGPTGAFIVVVAGVIATHGYTGLVAATFLAGIILIIAGLLRAGQLVRHVPEAVINGFTIGIGVIIGTSQLADLFGLTGPFPADFLEKIPALIEALPDLSPASFGIGLSTMVLIVALRRAFPRLPGLIVAVALTSAAVALFDLPVETIRSRFGELPQSLPAPHLPELSFATLRELLPSALVIAFLAGVESLLSAMVADRMIGGRHRSNAELMAQGWANIGSSLFGGLPATGAIARTATNVRAGGKTPVAGIVHAVTLLAIMMLAAPLAGYLALPALSGLLLLTAWNMSEPHRWGEYLRGRRSDLVLLLITLALTVITDLTVAIGTGIALGLALRLSRRGTDNPDWNPRDK
ncbi:SulP family inorganic anion transporter [Celeribacter sp. PS-C1]|uniref:SulP family inorganic anion transporter n=1 Tax=Celeribacter sp. PS-C1 TaxID=2820813 RepID=UPI001CA57997|nr:SulP family inorganic anion transporter [Celeribacter sp. PS-C1]MBW6416441.1 SulP family inorganic anion transporter [Celeribacter sp. PS-C1]